MFRNFLIGCCLVLATTGCATEAVVPGSKAKIKPMTEAQMAHESVRVAAVQITGNWIWGHPPNPEGDSADMAVPYIERAAADGADLVVFPELYLGLFRVPSPTTDKIAEAARKHGINVMIGCFEVLDEEGNYGNATLIFDRRGEIIGRFFKAFQAVGEGPYLWPPFEDDPEWMMQPGQEFPVFDLDFGRVGILTCYDGYFPEIFSILSLKGAEIIIWPNARGGRVEDYIVRTKVAQLYVHMVCTNKAYGGGTMIAEWPRGIKAEAEPEQEDYIIADLDLAGLRNARANAREFHQRRPEIFSEIIRDYDIHLQYGMEDPVGLDVPPPSREAHEKILEGSNVPFQSPE